LEHASRDRIHKTGRKPKAIVAVDLFGMPAKFTEILEVAQRYDIPLLEDSAEALGSQYKGRPCGTFGDYGILSFNGNKMITTSGGGALICPSRAQKAIAFHYATQARESFPYYQHEHLGYNYRLSNVCAGIGCGHPAKIHVDVEALCKYLVSLGIETRMLWKPMHMQPVFKDAPAYTNGVSEYLFKNGLCLPGGPWVSDEDAVSIVSEIKEYISTNKNHSA
jgi:dTDP-4-amino-4,6-dideoxygalactose transaminase